MARSVLSAVSGDLDGLCPRTGLSLAVVGAVLDLHPNLEGAGAPVVVLLVARAEGHGAYR